MTSSGIAKQKYDQLYFLGNRIINGVYPWHNLLLLSQRYEIILIIQLSIIIYLLWRLIPVETQKEIKRKISKPKTELLEWTPPEEPEKKAGRTILKMFKKNDDPNKDKV